MKKSSLLFRTVIPKLRYGIICMCLMTFIAFRAIAQDYPVHVTTILTPPYSIYLADYTSPEANALQVILNLRDLDRPEYRVKLRVSIEGQGITLRTKQGYVPPAIIMQGGVPLVLDGVDLRSYFNPDNLDFAGISKSEFIRRGTLPEGFYTFRIEVLDYVRSLVVSNGGMANAWMILNDPPIINIPFNNDKVIATDPQNLMFSWTPRHTASPNAAFSTEYEFRLMELYPADRNPNDAVRAANSIFVERTNATSLNYSIAEPLLIPGRKYAFRVRAFDVSGRDLFKNDGYSEVVVFQYGDECVAPPAITAEALDAVRVKLSWETTAIHTRYAAQYRKKGNSDWVQEDVASNSLIIPGLQSGTQYEYQVKGVCGTIQGAFSALAIVETPQTAPDAFTCGTTPPAVPLNTEPYEGELIQGDAIHSSDFEIALDSIQKNTDGSYAGTGFALMPWFKFASIRVKFRDIKINKEKRVFSGNIVTIYTKNSRFVADLDLAREEMAQGQQATVAPVEVPGEFNGVVLPPLNVDIQSVTANTQTGQIIVQTATGETVTLDWPREQNSETRAETMVTDQNGDTWIVGTNGSVTQGPSMSGPQTITSAAAANFQVNFIKNNDQVHGFDGVAAGENGSAFGQYTTEQVNGADYTIAWKSVEAGAQDVINAKVEGQAAFPAIVGFKTANGPSASQPSMSADQKQVYVIGGVAGETQSLTAYASVKPEGQTEATDLVLGKLNVQAYNKVTNRVYIVPVKTPGGNSISVDVNQVAAKLNSIYRQAVAEWTVTLDPEFVIDQSMIQGLDEGQPTMFSSFNSKMKAFNRAFKSERGIDAGGYYVFLINGTGSSRAGIMPFKRKFGYIFMENAGDLATTIAHELGHGAFRLQHTFEQFPSTANQTTRNLMSYESGNPSELKKYQWDYVRNQETMISWLQDADESALGPNSQTILSYWEDIARNITSQGVNVFGIIYCRECSGSQTTSNRQITSDFIELKIPGKICLLSILTYDGSGKVANNVVLPGENVYVDPQRIAQATLAVTQSFDNNGQALSTLFANGFNGNCTSFIEPVLINICSLSDASANSGFLNSIYGSVQRCLEENGILIPTPSPGSEVTARLNIPLSSDEKFRVFFRRGQSDQTVFDSPGLTSTAVPNYTVTVNDDGSLSVELSDSFLTSLGERVPPSVWDDLRNTLNDLMQDAKLNLCDAGSGPHCVAEQLWFLQVVNLNLQSLATNNAIDEAMWKEGGVRNILPDYAKWDGYAGGVVDGLAEEAVGMPMMLVTIGQMAFDESKRPDVSQFFSIDGFQQIALGILDNTVAALSDPARRPHILAKTSVAVIFIFYGMVSWSGSMDDLLEKANQLASKIDNAPKLRAQITRLVELGDASQINRLSDLIDGMTSERLERILILVPDEKVDDLFEDLASSPALKDVFDGVWVDAWKKALDSGFPELWRRDPEFLSKLRNVWDYNFVNGTNAKLPNVLLEPTQLTKVSTETLQQLRNTFNSTVRADFLKTLGNNSNISSMLKKAGFTDAEVPSLVQKLQGGQGIPGYQVHHKIPLDFGGTNDFSNLILMKQTPYHSAFTSFQNSQIDIAVGQTQTLNFPRVTGSFYSPPYIE